MCDIEMMNGRCCDVGECWWWRWRWWPVDSRCSTCRWVVAVWMNHCDIGWFWHCTWGLGSASQCTSAGGCEPQSAHNHLCLCLRTGALVHCRQLLRIYHHRQSFLRTHYSTQACTFACIRMHSQRHICTAAPITLLRTSMDAYACATAHMHNCTHLHTCCCMDSTK